MILAIHLRLGTPDMSDLTDAAEALDALAGRLRSLRDSDRIPLTIRDRNGLPVGSCSLVAAKNDCLACRSIKKHTGHGTCGVCNDSW